ncbi:MAG: DUF6360 family protein [Haloferacaceae archaeon]
MPDRLLRINAFTTLDTIEGEAEGHDFREAAYAVANVAAPRRNPDRVTLELELDNADLGTLPAHADRVFLSPDEARTLAAALTEHADRVEDASGGGA